MVLYRHRRTPKSTECQYCQHYDRKFAFFPLATPPSDPDKGTTVVLIDGPTPFSSARAGTGRKGKIY